MHEARGAIPLAMLLLIAGAALAAADRVHPSPEAVQPLAVGERVPSVVLRRASGETADLAEQRGEAGALLVFYRGGW